MSNTVIEMLLEGERGEAADAINKAGCLTWAPNGEYFTFASGIQSKMKINLERIYSPDNPDKERHINAVLYGYRKLATMLVNETGVDFDLVSHVPRGPKPFADILSSEWGKNHVYPLNPKWRIPDINTPLVGEHKPNQKVLLIEDVISSAVSTEGTANALGIENLNPIYTIAIVDRYMVAENYLKWVHGITLAHLLTFPEFLSHSFDRSFITDGQFNQQMEEMEMHQSAFAAQMEKYIGDTAELKLSA